MSAADVVMIVCSLLILAVAFTVVGIRIAVWFMNRGNFKNGG